MSIIFFFQAEDGIRDHCVTGVQTCALPICSDDFDPQLDSMVRVQAGRLRGKLAEYYSVNGSDDAIVAELPRGTYVLAFHHRASPGRPHMVPLVESEQLTEPVHRK